MPEASLIPPYDLLPYARRAHVHTHPDRLAMVAALFGLSPPPVGMCRVLEIGCAAGTNLIPMAEQLPGSQFLGIDLAGRQIADGNTALAELKLPNVRLARQDILNVTDELGLFDYIIAHGVYSWLPPETSNKVLGICSRNLSPGGIAYVSYNTYPGWHVRGMVREMMVYHCRDVSDPAAKVRKARDLLDLLVKSIPAQNNVHGMALRGVQARLRQRDDSELYHDELAVENHPCYFHEFMERAHVHGLQYLGDADFTQMTVQNFPPGHRPPMSAAEVIDAEQHVDFIRNTGFRRTLLCHAGQTLQRHPSFSPAIPLWAASPAKPQTDVDLKSDAPVVFSIGSGKMTVTDHTFKGILLRLGQAWPASVAVDDLLAGKTPAQKQDLSQTLIRALGAGQIELSPRPSAFTTRPSVRPQVSPFARLQARSSDPLVNRRHEMIRPNDLTRKLIPFLDGHHDRAALLEAMDDLFRRKVLAPAPDSPREALDWVLASLGQLALLIA